MQVWERSSGCSATEVDHPACLTSDTAGVNQKEGAAKALVLHLKKIKSLLGSVLPRNNVPKEIKALARTVSRTLSDYAKMR